MAKFQGKLYKHHQCKTRKALNHTNRKQFSVDVKFIKKREKVKKKLCAVFISYTVTMYVYIIITGSFYLLTIFCHAVMYFQRINILRKLQIIKLLFNS